MGRNIHVGIVQYELGFRVVLESLYRVVVDYVFLKLFVGVLLVRPVLPTLHALTLHRSDKQKGGKHCHINTTLHASSYK